MQPQLHHTRRRVLAWLGALPFAGKAFGTDPNATSPQFTSEYALRIIRIVNTAQSWNKAGDGQYKLMPQLLQSSVMERLDPRRHMDSVNTKSETEFLRQLRLESEDVLPGWELQIHLSPEQDAYLLTMS